MDQDAFETSIRKLLKMVGVRSQREIEQAVAAAVARGDLAGDETLPAAMTLEIPAIKLQVRLEGEVRLRG